MNTETQRPQSKSVDPFQSSPVGHSDLPVSERKAVAWRNGVALAVILVAAFGLRLYRLGAGLWFDEVWVYVNNTEIPLGQMMSVPNPQNQHYLYDLVARVSLLLFGESPSSLRLPAVLFGVGSIAALYLFGRQVTSGRETLLAVALLAFSYHHIWFSQNARGYTALLFWALISSWLLLRAIERGRVGLWLLYALAAALGLFTQVTMLFVILAQFVIYGVSLLRPQRRERRKWIGLFCGFALAGVLTLALYAPVLPQFVNRTVGEERDGTTVKPWTNPLWTVLEFVRGMQVSLAMGVFAIAALFVLALGLVSYVRTSPALVVLLFMPAVIQTAFVIGLGRYLRPRFFFVLAGFGVLFAIRGAMSFGLLAGRLFRLSPVASDRLGAALAVGLVVVSALSVPYAYGPKQDYGGALAFVEQERRSGDAIVTVGLATLPYADYYKVGWQQAETRDELNAIRSKARRTWLLYTLPVHLASFYPEIMDTIEQEFEIIKPFPGTLGDGAIYVCRSDRSPL